MAQAGPMHSCTLRSTYRPPSPNGVYINGLEWGGGRGPPPPCSFPGWLDTLILTRGAHVVMIDRAGVDAARAFGTGCFKDHRTHDLRGLSESEIKVKTRSSDKKKHWGLFLNFKFYFLNGVFFFTRQGVEHWKRFFGDHQSYVRVGRVSHPPIDPSSPLPPHCDPKKDAEQSARWGVVGVPPPGHPAASAAAAVVAEAKELKGAANVVEPELDLNPNAKSGTGEKAQHEEL